MTRATGETPFRTSLSNEAAAEADPRPAVTIVVPAFNEAAALPSTLVTLLEEFPGYEILLVNDGSLDATTTVVEALAARFGRERLAYTEYRPNRGKGYAVRVGMLSGRGDILVFTDADLPFGVDGVRLIVRRLQGDPSLDIAIAAKTRVTRSATYRAARVAARALIAMLTGLRYPDTQAGLKGFRRTAAREVFARAATDRFAADVEMLYLAEKLGLRVASIPMAVTNEYERPSSFSLRQGFRVLRDVFRMRFRDYGLNPGMLSHDDGLP
jgi:glycosyltransferase involved in cell wall biosynthesis